jgi:transglutaminase-like putative cysteine protease
MSTLPPSPGTTGTGVVARWSLHLALIAALGALVVGGGHRSVLLLLIPLALLPALRWRRAPRAVVLLLPTLGHLALAGVFVIAVLSRQVRLIRDDVGVMWGGILGWMLAVLAVVFLLGHRIWKVTATVVPATLGLLVVGGLDPTADLFPWFAGASALALWAWAFVSGGPRRLGVPLALFAASAAGLALATLQFLPWAQPHVERALAERFAGGTTGLAEESRLGEFGELAVSDRVVLRVWTSRPALLRAFVHTHFDGQEWSTPTELGALGLKPVQPTASLRAEGWLRDVPGPVFALEPGVSLVPDDETLVETRIVQSAVRDWPLLVPARPLLVRAPTSILLRSRQGELRWPPLEPARLYGVVDDRGRHGPRDAELSVTARVAALGLPRRLDPRLRILAGTLAADARGDRARLRGTVDWLRANFTYSLEVGEFQTGDPLAEFLLVKKRGYCEYFATAAAVLLRLQGVPARYVKGFSVGPQNLYPAHLGVPSHYVVRERDAHAWVEAWIEGEGWVEADPTPPDGFARLHSASPGWMASFVEAFQAQAAALWAHLTHEGLTGLFKALGAAVGSVLEDLWRHPAWVGLGVALLLALVSGRWVRALLSRWHRARRLRRERRAAFPGELGRLLSVVEGHWARQGQPRPAARGLHEHLESLPPERLTPAQRQASAAIIAACYRSAYGGRLPPPEELDDLRAAATRLE